MCWGNIFLLPYMRNLNPWDEKSPGSRPKVQAFGNFLDDAVQYVQACDEDLEISDKFTCLGSVIHSSGKPGHNINRHLDLAYSAMDLLKKSMWHFRYLSRGTRLRIFKTLVIPVLLYGCET